jgi:hypothetical protein
MFFFPENSAFHAIILNKNIVQPGSLQMTIWRIRIASWNTKATNNHSESVILIAFSTVTMVTRTRLNITFVILPVFLLSKS